MKGKKEKSPSGENQDKNIKTDTAATDKPQEKALLLCNAKTLGSAADSSASLKSILASISSTQMEWLKAAYAAVLTRFRRMPRKGWDLLFQCYCGKFQSDISLEAFRKSAVGLLTTSTGRRCTARKFQEESVKRRKTIEEVFEENTIREAKLYLELRSKFCQKFAENKKRQITEAEHPRKVPSEKVNSQVLKLLNKAAGEIVSKYPPETMSDIARNL